MLRLKVVKHLWVVEPQIAHPGIAPSGGIVGKFGDGVISFKTDVMAGALLKPDLQRMVPGVGIQRRQPLEAAVKLRVGFQQQLLWDGVINVARIHHISRVKNRTGRAPWTRQRRTCREETLERIRDFGVEIIRYSGIVGIVGRI